MPEGGFVLQFLTIIGVITNVVIASVLSYGMYRAYQDRNQIQWSARHFEPLYATIVWSIAFICIERNLQLLGSVAVYFDLTSEGRWLLNNLFCLGFLSLYALRCWLVHFDYHTGVAMFVRVTNIKLTMEEEEHFGWFLSNKSNYGSPKYLRTFLVVMNVIINALLFGWLLVSPATFYYGVAGIYALIIIIIMGIAKKITVMDDEFFIRRELLLEFRILGGFFILSGIFIAFGPVMTWPWAAYFIVETSVLTIAGMGCIATWWMLEKSELFTKPLLMAEKRAEAGEIKDATSASGVPPLELVLSDKVAVATFLKHLIRELSVENLFFLADVMHYKKSFVDNNKFRDIPGFYKNVPDLLARYAYIPDRTFTHYAWALSKAYVDDISAFYVTAMDEDTREQILFYLGDLDPSKEGTWEAHEWTSLCNAFDAAATQIYTMIKQSYQRFAKTSKFQQLQLSEASAGGRMASNTATEMAQKLRERNASQGTTNQ